MLPFTGYSFFVVAAVAILLLYIVKYTFKKRDVYEYTILGLSLIFTIFFFPKPAHILIFVGYAYVMHYLFVYKIKIKNKLPGVIALTLPMILVKAFIISPETSKISSAISFAGLSYIAFRIVHIFIESTPKDKPLNPVKYLNFLIFTPTVLIGPIDRYKRFNGDIQRGFSGVNAKSFEAGLQLIVFGIMHKFILAEAVSRYWLNADVSTSAVLSSLNEMYAYYFYLYFDFAGYSAMAIGLGKILGIDVPINFNKPFLARNPQDFWRRFHKTLGDFLNDFFFKPLYMFFSRKKSLKKHPLLRQNSALFLTFLLMGVWNGFNKHFIISGALFGLYSLLYNTYAYRCKKARKDVVFGNLNPKVVTVISILITFNITALSLYIFSGRFPLL